jgi:hypothetical protein
MPPALDYLHQFIILADSVIYSVITIVFLVCYPQPHQLDTRTRVHIVHIPRMRWKDSGLRMPLSTMRLTRQTTVFLQPAFSREEGGTKNETAAIAESGSGSVSEVEGKAILNDGKRRSHI